MSNWHEPQPFNSGTANMGMTHVPQQPNMDMVNRQIEAEQGRLVPQSSPLLGAGIFDGVHNVLGAFGGSMLGILAGGAVGFFLGGMYQKSKANSQSSNPEGCVSCGECEECRAGIHCRECDCGYGYDEDGEDGGVDIEGLLAEAEEAEEADDEEDDNEEDEDEE